MFGNFLMKAMLKKQLKNVPAAEQDRIIGAIEKNPDFFKKIAEETQEKVKGGMSQQDAVLSVLKSHQDEFKKVMGQ
jgi:predicted transcriptional regulator